MRLPWSLISVCVCGGGGGGGACVRVGVRETDISR